MKFICPKCGEVKPKEIYDSCPAQASCPKCNKWIREEDGIHIMSEEEGVLKRPDFYKKHYPELYEKYKGKIM